MKHLAILLFATSLILSFMGGCKQTGERIITYEALQMGQIQTKINKIDKQLNAGGLDEPQLKTLKTEKDRLQIEFGKLRDIGNITPIKGACIECAPRCCTPKPPPRPDDRFSPPTIASSRPLVIKNFKEVKKDGIYYYRSVEKLSQTSTFKIEEPAIGNIITLEVSASEDKVID